MEFDTDWLDQRIADHMSVASVPGLAIAVLSGGEIVHACGYGVRSIDEPDISVTPSTLFQIGSTTKPLTGALIVRLVDEGLVTLDTPISDAMPDLQLSSPDAVQHITMRMLLSHTAGLPWDQITPTRLHGSRDADALAAWVASELPERPFVGPPGGQWSYSNPGINLAARIAEVVIGRRYTELMRTCVFVPLAMHQTTFDPLEAMTWPIAQAHQLDSDGCPRVLHRVADNAAQYPSAFAWSTVMDLANFALMHLRSGRFHGTQLLAPASTLEMHLPQANRGDTPGAAYGLTFFIDDDATGRRVSHPGGISGFSSDFVLYPASGTAVIVLCNLAGTEIPRGVVRDALAMLSGEKLTADE